MVTNHEIKTVCLVSREYPEETDFGGISTYMKYLSVGLTKNNIHVIVIARSYLSNSYNNENNIEIYRICDNNENKYREKVADLIYRLSREIKIDIIESPEWGADLYVYFKKHHKSLKIPVVIKLHTPYFIWKKYNYCNITNENIEDMERHVVLSADGVFSCSNALARIVAKEYKMQLNDINVIPNMISNDEPNDFIDFEKNSICYIGSIEQRKGVFILAEAFKIVKEKIPSAKLIFVGRDTERNDKKTSSINIIKDILHGTNDVNFVEHVSNIKIKNYMEKANLLICPSLFENFPYVVLEGMKYGCAIIGSENGGMNEIIQKGVSGELYTPPNAIQLAEIICDLLLNENKVLKYKTNAQKRIKDFSIEKITIHQLK